jgi:hypothetical protein
MRKEVQVVVLLCAVIVLLFMNVRQWGTIQRLRHEALTPPSQPEAQRTARTQPPVRPATAPRAAPVSSPAFAAPQSRRAKPASQPPKLPRQPLPAAQAAPSPGNAIAEMYDLPEVKDMIRTQQKMMLDQQYGELFAGLDLSGEMQAELKELLTVKMTTGLDTGMKLMDGEISVEEYQQQAQEVARSLVETENRIHALLGEDDFAYYQQFEDTQMERMQVDMLRQNLPPDNLPTWEQENELIIAMHEERNQFVFNVPDLEQPSLGVSGMNEEQIQSHLDEMDSLHEQYLVRAATILNEDALEAFSNSLQQWLAMQEMSLRMAAKLLPPAEATN